MVLSSSASRFLLITASLLTGVSKSSALPSTELDEHNNLIYEHMSGIAPYHDAPGANIKPPKGCNIEAATFLFRHSSSVILRKGSNIKQHSQLLSIDTSFSIFLLSGSMQMMMNGSYLVDKLCRIADPNADHISTSIRFHPGRPS